MKLFERTGFETIGYLSAEEFLAAEQDPARFGCIVSEMKLPGADGIELLTELRNRNSWLPLIILTDNPDVRLAVTALHHKVSDYLVKPVVERELIKSIRTAMRGAISSRVSVAKNSHRITRRAEPPV